MEYVNHLDKRIKQIDMKNKKYKVEIPEGYEVNRSFTTKTVNKEISTTVVFEPIKKELPKTWEEYCELEEVIIPHQLSIVSKYRKEISALSKLLELRDHYNDGWEPNWNNCSNKYCIFNRAGTIMDITEGVICHVLVFKTDKLRAEFISNFAQLIETAKSLL